MQAELHPLQLILVISVIGFSALMKNRSKIPTLDSQKSFHFSCKDVAECKNAVTASELAASIKSTTRWQHLHPELTISLGCELLIYLLEYVRKSLPKILNHS